MSSVTEAITFGLGEQGMRLQAAVLASRTQSISYSNSQPICETRRNKKEEAAKFQRDLAEIYKRNPSSYQGHGWSEKEMKRHCDYLAKAALKASAKLSRVADYQEWIAEQMREH